MWDPTNSIAHFTGEGPALPGLIKRFKEELPAELRGKISSFLGRLRLQRSRGATAVVLRRLLLHRSAAVTIVAAAAAVAAVANTKTTAVAAKNGREKHLQTNKQQRLEKSTPLLAHGRTTTVQRCWCVWCPSSRGAIHLWPEMGSLAAGIPQHKEQGAMAAIRRGGGGPSSHAHARSCRHSNCHLVYCVPSFSDCPCALLPASSLWLLFVFLVLGCCSFVVRSPRTPQRRERILFTSY